MNRNIGQKNKIMSRNVNLHNWNPRNHHGYTDERELIVITKQPIAISAHDQHRYQKEPTLHQALGLDVAVKQESQDCWFGWIKCIHKFCCFRCDCRSRLSLYDAISRYEDEFTLPVETFIEKVTNNLFMVSILESLYKSYPDFFFTFLPTGSLREGFGKLIPSTSILATDYDIMLVPDGVSVGELQKNDAGELLDSDQPLFTVIDAAQDYLEGYLWLKLENTYLTQWEKICLRRHVKNEGCSLLSSYSWREMLKDTVRNYPEISQLAQTNYRQDNVNVSVTTNGPALTVEVSANYTKCCSSSQEKTRFFYADFTLALHCVRWPERAKGFFTSEFRKNWPPEEAVNLIKKLGCHVVPKSSSNCLVKLSSEQGVSTTYGQSTGLEWRYSFSQPEIILSEHIPPEVRTAYLAFKALVKRHFNRRFGEINSYTLKCIMYYVVERKPEQFWENERSKIVECVFTDMLARLNECLENGKCENYWIPAINLLSNLTESDLVSKRALMALVMKSPHDYVTTDWLEYTRCVRLNCCYCGHGYIPPYNEMPTVLQNELDRSCACCRIKCSYKEDSCCGRQYRIDPLSLDVY